MFYIPPVAVVRGRFDAQQSAEDEVDVLVPERLLAESFAEGRPRTVKDHVHRDGGRP